MSNFDAASWQNTTADDNNNSDAPEPGIYDALLADARAFTANSGKDFVVLSWQVASGPSAGKAWDVLYGFGSDGARKALKSTLIRIGIDADMIASLDEMDTAVKAACGEWYTVEVRQNGNFINTYVNGKTGPPAVSDVPSNPEEFAVAKGNGQAKTEEVPFKHVPVEWESSKTHANR